MNSSDVVSIILIVLIALAVLGFTVRVVGGLFSPKIRKKIRAHPNFHSLWFLFCLGIFFLVFPRQPPTDADMVDYFHKHKPELLNLVTMLREDVEVKWIDDSYISPESIIDEKRWSRYRHLMASASVRSISVYRVPMHKIEFHLIHGGDFLRRFSKGCVYSTREPGPIKDNLDRSRNHLTPYASFYKKVKGDWYIKIQRNTDW